MGNDPINRIVISQKITHYVSVGWHWMTGNHDPLEILLTGGAIVLAFYILRETRRQVDEAHAQVVIMQESARKELKAYVDVSSLPKVPLQLTIDTFVWGGQEFWADTSVPA